MSHDGLRALRYVDRVSGYAHADALLTPRQPERTCRLCGTPLERSRRGDVCGLHETGLAGNEPRVA